MYKNKRIMLLAVTSAFLFACNKGEQPVTYNLLWNTKIEPIENHVHIQEKDTDGVTIYKQNEDGSISDNLKVLMFTDLHLDHKKAACEYTYTMMAKNIMLEKPDLVLFCGDNITSTLNEPRARDFCKLLEDLNVYWSCCLGNHEGNNPGLTRSEMVQLFDSYPHCLLDSSVKKTSDGKEVWGNGNHAIKVLKDYETVSQIFFFLDSGDIMSKEDMQTYQNEIQWMKDKGKVSKDETEFYDYIKDSQVKWYKQVMDHNDGANSIILSHVPLKDMEDAYLSYYNAKMMRQGIGSNENIWPYTEVLGKEGDITMLLGHRAEDMCYGPHDAYYCVDGTGHTPMFEAMLEKGGAHPAFFAGHDHQNNFVLEQTVNGNKITMGYIQPAGYSSNNFWTKGMLGWDPTAEEDKYHLIQGYSVMYLKLSDAEKPFTIRKETNYHHWLGHYEEAFKLISAVQKAGKEKYIPAWDYEKNVSIYPNDPNDPLKGGPKAASI